MNDTGRAKVPFAQSIATRDGSLTKDSKMVNCFMEPSAEGKAVIKRPGTKYLTSLTDGGVPQGQFLLNDLPYFIYNDSVYNLATGVAVAIPSVTQALGQYTTLSDTPFGTSFLKSTSGLWSVTITNGALVLTKYANKGTDSYPATTVSGLSYLDGTYYVMDEEGTIYGSYIQDATIWPALNYIRADVTLGQGVGVVRHLNYLIAFYTHGTQFFYDAGLTPGLPIAPVGNAAWTTGCAAGSSFKEASDVTFFVSKTRQFGRTVSKFEGLSLNKISTPFIEKILNRSTLANMSSFNIKTAGHAFYGITLLDLDITLVYDIAFEDWHVWTSNVGGIDFCFSGVNYLGTETQDLFQDTATGNVMVMDAGIYTDATGQIGVEIVTGNVTFGTEKRKRYAAVFVGGDTIDSVLSIQYSDDDYQTYSPFRVVDLSTTRKMLQRCGMSRMRAWRIVHTDNVPLRLLELEINLEVAES